MDTLFDCDLDPSTAAATPNVAVREGDETSRLLAFVTPTLDLASGRTVEATTTHEGELVTVRSATGHVELRVRLTDAGPVLEMTAVQLRLRAEGAVTVDCERFDVRASDRIRLSSQGDIEERALGDKHESVGGVATTAAASVHIQAIDGDLKLHAAQDLYADGRKRVLINS